MSSRSASKTCLNWSRVLRLKVSWFMTRAPGLVFEVGQPLGQVAVRGRQRPHAHEGAHDLDVHRNGARAAEHR